MVLYEYKTAVQMTDLGPKASLSGDAIGAGVNSALLQVLEGCRKDLYRGWEVISHSVQLTENGKVIISLVLRHPVAR